MCIPPHEKKSLWIYDNVEKRYRGLEFGIGIGSPAFRAREYQDRDTDITPDHTALQNALVIIKLLTFITPLHT